MSTRFEYVYFMPWVGLNYGRKNHFKLNLMVLGESHYRWGRPHGQHETVRLVSDYIKPDSRNLFGRKVRQLICGEEDVSAGDFWDSILFYNYVQAYVGNEPQVRPTSSMWAEAEPGFLEVIRYYSPDVIVVLGKKLWDHLPKEGKGGPTISDGKEEQGTLWFPTKKGKRALASFVWHPSYRGFSVSDWHPIVRVLMETAKESKRKKS